MDDKITRLLYILNRLDKGEVNLKQVADDMGVALRTVQRYIATIQDAEFPVYDTTSPAATNVRTPAINF